MAHCPMIYPAHMVGNVVCLFSIIMNVGISLTTASTFWRVPCSASEALVFVAALWHIKFQMCKSHGWPWLLVEISTSCLDSILWIWRCGLMTRISWTELRFWGCFWREFGVIKQGRMYKKLTKEKGTLDAHSIPLYCLRIWQPFSWNKTNGSQQLHETYLFTWQIWNVMGLKSIICSFDVSMGIEEHWGGLEEWLVP